MALSNTGIKVVRTNPVCSTVLEEKPKKVHGANPSICYVRRNIGSKGANSFIHFPAPVPKDATVISATLTITTATTWGPAFTLSVYELNERYTPGKVTWANQPSNASTVTHKSITSGAGKGVKVNIDVTNHVKNSQTKSNWFGFKVFTGSPDHTNYRNFYGAGSHRPTLTVVYTLPIDKPSRLSPGSEDLTKLVYTSTPKPTYSAVYDDNTSTAVISALQIQLTSTFSGSTPSFTAPLWNPGWKTTVNGEYVSANDVTAPTLVAGVKYAWRIRFRSTQGIESPWSDPVILSYAAQVGVSINKTSSGSSFGNLATNPSFENVNSATKVYVRRNRSTNPSFEVSNGGTVSVPAGGTAPDVMRQGGGGVVTATGGVVAYLHNRKTTTWPVDGTYSICLDARNASTNNNFVDLLGATSSGMTGWGLTAGKTYTVSASMFMDNPQVGTLNANARSIRIDLTAPSVNGGTQMVGWKTAQAVNSVGTQRVFTTFTLPNDTTNVRIVLVNGENSVANGGGGGRIWWDGLLVEESPRLLDWFTGGTVITQSSDDGFPILQTEDSGALGSRMFGYATMRQGGGGPVSGSALGYRINSSDVQSSAYSLAIDPAGATTNDTYVRPAGDISGSMARLGLVAGKSYTISADLFIPEAQTGSLHINARSIVLTIDRSGVLTNLASIAGGNTSGGLYRVSERFTLPTDTTNAYISLYNGAKDYDSATDTGGQTVYWDNLRITEDTDSEYVDGSMDGWDWTDTDGASSTQVQAVVYSSTPTFTWVVTGGFQRYAEIIVMDPALAESKREIWTSGRIDTQVQEISIPEKVVKTNGKPYTIVVRVEDELSREPTHNNEEYFPVYAEDRLDFIYTLSSDVTGPLSIQADMSGPIHVLLTWTVADEPDMFELLRDGEIVVTDLIPDSLRVGDRKYQIPDRGVVSNKTHVWEIRNIVDEKTSASNPTTSKTIKTGMLWLYATETPSATNNTRTPSVIIPGSTSSTVNKSVKYINLVPIAGEAPAEMALYEKGETFEPLNGNTPVRITEALGGYRGTVSGVLCGECLKDGTTSRDLQKRMLDIRSDIGAIYTLHLDNVTIPVIVYNVNTFPLYGARFGKSYGVTFEFFEVR